MNEWLVLGTVGSLTGTCETVILCNDSESLVAVARHALDAATALWAEHGTVTVVELKRLTAAE